MKRLIVLVFAVIMVSLVLCSCMENTANRVKETASEALSDIRNSLGATQGRDDLTDTDRDTDPTYGYAEDNTDGIYTEEGNMDSEWDDMADDGRVEDGDGNVGELENRDGDENTDEEAAEYAQERVSADESYAR